MSATLAGRSVVIADDEPLARERLRHLLSNHPTWNIVAGCRNGVEAVDAILVLRPDVVFLDIRMPGLDGLEVAEAVAGDDADPSGQHPIVVFVTAFDAFALRAFDVNAADYVLKPIDRERFTRTLVRLETRLSAGVSSATADIGAILGELRPGRHYAHRLLVRSTRGYYFVQVADIEWVEAEGNYAALHVSDRVHLVRYTMKTLEQRLDPAIFARVHRSAIVNVSSIVRAEPLGHGEYRLHLERGAQLESSRAYAAQVQALLRD